jgi:hypothetical protein
VYFKSFFTTDANASSAFAWYSNQKSIKRNTLYFKNNYPVKGGA